MPQASAEEARAKRRAALLSVAVSAGLTAMKLAAGLASGSLALLSEGVHNALDIAASGLTYFAVRAGDKPADEGHPFGHAKVEAVAALAQTAFLFALALGVAVMALRRLGQPAEVAAGAFAFVVVLASIALDIYRWRALRRVARATGSHALQADALHYGGDLVASCFVLVGLAAARVGLGQGDALAALAVSGFIAVSGYRLARDTIDALVDAAPEGLADEVRAVLRGVGGVEGVDYLRLRRSGAGAVGELGLLVSRTLPLEGVAAIKQRAQAALGQRWPRLALTIAANPLALDDESVLERVLLIAARRKQFVHHVTIQRLGGRIVVSLDLEVDGQMPLGEAHEVASRLEAAIAADFGGGVEVDTHIEPMATGELDGADADPAMTRALADCLRRRAEANPLLRDVHNVRLRAAGPGYFAVFHCRADRGATVEAVHGQVDALERAAHAEFPAISRIIGHAEPV
ncbi:MAG: cation diffusion facilitator family transporter [Pseudomonadota bacterium]|nr:cation diffusion facilitator family transporter [Pseudomonadota bacterium]